MPGRQINRKRLICEQILGFFQADGEKVCMRGTLEKFLVTGKKLTLLQICPAAQIFCRPGLFIVTEHIETET